MQCVHGSQVSSIEKATVGIVILCCNVWDLIWEDFDCEGLELLELEDPPPTCIYLPYLSAAWTGIDGRLAQLGCWLDHAPTTWASRILLAKFWEEGLKRGPLQSEHFKKTISKPTRLWPSFRNHNESLCPTSLVDTTISLPISKQGERKKKIPPLSGKSVKVTLQKSMGDGRYYCIHLWRYNLLWHG